MNIRPIKGQRPSNSPVYVARTPSRLICGAEPEDKAAGAPFPVGRRPLLALLATAATWTLEQRPSLAEAVAEGTPSVAPLPPAPATPSPPPPPSTSPMTPLNAMPRTPIGATYLDKDAQAALEAALNKHVTKQKAPVLLRLAFHDCGTFDTGDKSGGSNGSIRYELDRPENFGLKRGVRVVDECLAELKGTPAEPLISFSDMIALAGARAVRVTGGPDMMVAVGRVDAVQGDPTGRLPSENATAAELKAYFGRMGMSVQEMVALCGAHTLGSKGFGDPVVFDNTYYKTLLAAPWAKPGADEMAQMIGLPSDHGLGADPECRPYIEKYAADQDRFFTDFASAYLRMARSGVQWRWEAAGKIIISSPI